MELPLGAKFTKSDVAKIFNPKDIKDFLPNGYTYIKSGKLTLETLPGFWVHFKMKRSRVRNTIEMEGIMYNIFYKNKIIQIHGQVAISANGKKIERGGFKKYETLFDLVANSFVMPDIYQDK